MPAEAEHPELTARAGAAPGGRRSGEGLGGVVDDRHARALGPRLDGLELDAVAEHGGGDDREAALAGRGLDGREIGDGSIGRRVAQHRGQADVEHGLDDLRAAETGDHDLVAVVALQRPRARVELGQGQGMEREAQGRAPARGRDHPLGLASKLTTQLAAKGAERVAGAAWAARGVATGGGPIDGPIDREGGRPAQGHDQLARVGVVARVHEL
ncbi:hypothetical protein ENSA5_29890 [Enhygromyxa salina]|uniref:Uncharacterized protein n=1 Tax=Enhygromyxa salina TaxID=215803 RepID=A0A2S9XZG2_9BACT|nr:hypothetical protein ENSA5_29890 [Enhygromyxa salina]